MIEPLPDKKDKVIADTGWGIKPDDQPANRNESTTPADVFQYDPKLPDVVRTILRLQRRSFNIANSIKIEPGRTTVIDLNGDSFVVFGLGFGDPNLIELMMELGAAFDPQILGELKAGCSEIREYPCGRVWAWGHERSGG